MSTLQPADELNSIDPGLLVALLRLDDTLIMSVQIARHDRDEVTVVAVTKVLAHVAAILDREGAQIRHLRYLICQHSTFLSNRADAALRQFSQPSGVMPIVLPTAPGDGTFGVALDLAVWVPAGT